MSHVLLMALAGPMQSWGTRSRFQIRDTEREPSKSGVIGLLCAALGRDRQEPLDDLVALRMGVRVDREGAIHKDFQTAQDVATANEKKRNVVSDRYYLSDAVFLVGLEGNDLYFMKKLHKALSNPVWPLFLGRKSYIPSTPPYLPDGLKHDMRLGDALLSYPLLAKARGRLNDEDNSHKQRMRFVIETMRPERESRMDTPVSFSIGSREHRRRFVVTEFCPIKEGGLQCTCLR